MSSVITLPSTAFRVRYELNSLVVANNKMTHYDSMLIGNIFILMTTVSNDQDQYIKTFVGLLRDWDSQI